LGTLFHLGRNIATQGGYSNLKFAGEI